MRRILSISLLFGATLLAQGCVGFDNFIENTLTTTTNPNRPLGDSTNMRRVQGMGSEVEPVVAEPGNVWPRGVERLPTLQDLEGGRASEPARPPGRVSQAPVPRQAVADASPVAASPAPAAEVATESQALPDLARPARPGQRYRTVSTPTGTAVLAPNGDGTSTLMRADGTVETIPAGR